MDLVLDEAGHVKLQDGKPLYRHSDGREIPFDAAGTVATINRLNSEAKGHRIKAEEFEAKVKAFEGLDPEAARKALDTIANIDAKKLIDAGAVEQVKAETAKAWEEKLKATEAKYEPVIKERDELNAKLIDRTISSAFAGSKFIGDKLAVPADMVRAAFGSAFKVEGDAVVAYKDGNKLFSRERPGEIAGFDEALSMLVEAYPHRDSILKGSGASGGGARGSGGANGGKTMARAAFMNMAPTEQAAFAKAGGTVTD